MVVVVVIYGGNGGGGGTQTSGGAGGIPGGSRNCRLIRSPGSGGIGGLINSTGQAGTNYGAVGGAGGGLTGAAGANGIYTVNWIGGGGGGGSSFTYSGVTGVIHTQGYQTGNGQVIITWNGFVSPFVKNFSYRSGYRLIASDKCNSIPHNNSLRSQHKP